MDQRVNGVGQNQSGGFSGRRTTRLTETERSESYRIQLTRNGQVAIPLKLLQRRCSRWSSFTIGLT